MLMTPVSRVVELFGGTGPGEGRDLFVGGGGYSEQLPGAEGRTVYYPGGSATLGELNKAAAVAGPSGMVGGFRKRKSQKRKTKRRRRSSRSGK